MRKRWQRVSKDQMRELWSRWKAGEAVRPIGQSMGLQPDTVYQIVVRRGGLAPRERTRAAWALSLPEREEISRALAAGAGIRGIARELDRAPSTISREIRRHGGRRGYRATAADRRAWRRALRPKPRRLDQDPRLRAAVLAKLHADWSPQQISAWLVRTFPDDRSMRLSHEALYRTLYVQARGTLKQELIKHLRQRRIMRRTGGRRITQGKIVDPVSISERPAAAADRAIPGHWEGDLLVGTPRSRIATLVERRSRYVILVRVPGRDTTSVVRALIRRVRQMPRGLMQSLTWDRGTEMAAHKTFSIATDIQVYFCDPRSPWQRGSNENTNGLLRQYFPKGGDLSNVTQRQLDAVALKLNTRPRQTLNWETPAAILAATVAANG